MNDFDDIDNFESEDIFDVEDSTEDGFSDSDDYNSFEYKDDDNFDLFEPETDEQDDHELTIDNHEVDSHNPELAINNDILAVDNTQLSVNDTDLSVDNETYDIHSDNSQISFGSAYTKEQYLEKEANCVHEASLYYDKAERALTESQRQHYINEAKKWDARAADYKSEANYQRFREKKKMVRKIDVK